MSCYLFPGEPLKVRVVGDAEKVAFLRFEPGKGFSLTTADKEEDLKRKAKNERSDRKNKGL